MSQSYWMKEQEGNFSRAKKDNFDASKNNIGIRMQQGVPFLDRDWNEMEDIRRYQEIVLRKYYIGNGVPGKYDFKIEKITDNGKIVDLKITPGRCLIDGFEAILEPVSEEEPELIFSEQEDVEAIKTGDQIVYIDLWIQEITVKYLEGILNSIEDENEKIKIEEEIKLLSNMDDVDTPTTIKHRILWKVKTRQLNPDTLDKDENHFYYTLAHLVSDEVVDMRRTSLSIKSLIDNADIITSYKIKEADGTSGQDTNNGTGIKTGHIQDGAITASKIASGATPVRYIISSDITSNGTNVFNSINDCLSYIKEDITGKRIGKIFVMPKDNGESWEENINLLANDWGEENPDGWSNLEIEFDRKTKLKSALTDGSPTIKIDGAGSQEIDIIPINHSNQTYFYTYENGTFTENQTSIESLNDEMRYIVIDHDYYKISSYTDTTISIDDSYKKFNGASHKIRISHAVKNYFKNIKITVNLDNEAKEGANGVVVAFAEVELNGNISNCKTAELDGYFSYDDLIVNNMCAYGAGISSYYSKISGDLNINNCVSTKSGGGMFVLASNVKVNDIKNCMASDSGGGFSAYDSIVYSGNISNCSCMGDSFDGWGGGFLCEKSHVVVGNINNCNANSQGGAFRFAISNVKTGNISNCLSRIGGGFVGYSGNIETGNIKICKANETGGGFYIFDYCSIKVGNIMACEANDEGGFHLDQDNHVIFGIAEENTGGTVRLAANSPSSCIVQGIDKDNSHSTFGGNYII